MSVANQGTYGTQANGAPYTLSPQMLLQMILMPQLKAMLQAGGPPNTADQTNSFMSWARSQANQGPSGRAIAPTIPGYTLPAPIQQIMAQKAPLSEIASKLNPGGAPASTNQFAAAPSGNAPAPLSTQGAPAQAPAPDFLTQIINQAVRSALEQGGGPQSGGGGGGPSPEPPSSGGGLDRSPGSPDLAGRGV